jgi:hypothetical protein
VPATAAFDDDDPMALKTGFFLGAPEVEGLRDIAWISLLDCEGLGLSWPPVSLVSCFISLRRWWGGGCWLACVVLWWVVELDWLEGGGDGSGLANHSVGVIV